MLGDHLMTCGSPNLTSQAAPAQLHGRWRFAFLPLLLLIGCAQDAESHGRGGPPPIYVDIAAVERQPIRDVVAMVGAFAADESVMIRPEVEGLVAELHFDEGQRVAKGDLLVRLRDGAERARLAEAEALLELARQEFERAKTLAARRTLSQSELDRSGAEIAVARARLELRRVELAEKEIRAPFDGVLGARLVSLGARVDRETDLVQIDSVDPLRILFTLPEMALGLARSDLALEISVAAFPGETFAGEVYFVAPTVDPRNRRVMVKGMVANPDRKLRPGMFANIRVEVANLPSAVVVPESAIAYDTRGSFVWRVAPGDIAERVGVASGIRDAGLVEIREGLAEGDSIVTAGTHKVTEGAHLSVGGTVDAAAP